MDDILTQLVKEFDLLRSAYRKAQRKNDTIGMAACERVMLKILELMKSLHG